MKRFCIRKGDGSLLTWKNPYTGEEETLTFPDAPSAAFFIMDNLNPMQYSWEVVDG